MNNSAFNYLHELYVNQRIGAFVSLLLLLLLSQHYYKLSLRVMTLLH